MKKLIKVKYTDSYEKIRKNIPLHDFTHEFKRDVWFAVPVNIAIILLKDQRFIAEDDIIFSPAIFNAAGLNIGLKRFGAFGDLIQLIPIVKHLKKISTNKYTLITNKQYVNDMKEFGVFDNVLPTGTIYAVFDKVIYLDGVAEKDHSLTNHQHLMHRVNIFEEFLNIHLTDYDFSVNINEHHKKVVDEVLKNAFALQQNQLHTTDLQQRDSLPNCDKSEDDCRFEWFQGLSEARL